MNPFNCCMQNQADYPPIRQSVHDAVKYLLDYPEQQAVEIIKDGQTFPLHVIKFKQNECSDPEFFIVPNIVRKDIDSSLYLGHGGQAKVVPAFGIFKSPKSNRYVI
ncbi:MAG: hypothetical protein ACE365_08415, partial [Gammaproteobacteria bacterium]